MRHVASYCLNSLKPIYLLEPKHLHACVLWLSVGYCGKTGRENCDMECSNIGVCRGTYDAVKLKNGEKSRAVRSYADVTREDVQKPLGQNRIITP